MTIVITPALLDAVSPLCGPHALTYAAPLTTACARFNANTPQRVAAFLAQIMQESGALNSVVENLMYSAARLRIVWPDHFPSTAIAAQYAYKPQQIASRAYADRMGNGDEASGDGWMYRGRGLIQVTGKDNYAAMGKVLRLPLVPAPEMLEQPDNAALSAAAFWQTRGCNELADSNDFQQITRKITGGTTALAQRYAFWDNARRALKLEESEIIG